MGSFSERTNKMQKYDFDAPPLSEKKINSWMTKKSGSDELLPLSLSLSLYGSSNRSTWYSVLYCCYKKETNKTETETNNFLTQLPPHPFTFTHAGAGTISTHQPKFFLSHDRDYSIQ